MVGAGLWHGWSPGRGKGGAQKSCTEGLSVHVLGPVGWEVDTIRVEGLESGFQRGRS